MSEKVHYLILSQRQVQSLRTIRSALLTLMWEL